MGGGGGGRYNRGYRDPPYGDAVLQWVYPRDFWSWVWQVAYAVSSFVSHRDTGESTKKKMETVFILQLYRDNASNRLPQCNTITLHMRGGMFSINSRMGGSLIGAGDCKGRFGGVSI